MVLSRRDFLVTGVCALGCVVAGCGPHVDGTVVPQSGRATLTFTQFPALARAGGGVVVDVTGRDPIAVVRTAADAVVALDAVCTHAGCTLAFDETQLACGCHGSTFALDGAVTHGPANRPLRHFPAMLAADSIVVDVG